MKTLNLATLSLLGLLALPLTAAASEEEVLAFLEDYSALEGDLDAQSRYIRDDRVWIAVSRWAHGPDFMAWQEAQRDHRAKQTDGQGDAYHVQMEDRVEHRDQPAEHTRTASAHGEEADRQQEDGPAVEVHEEAIVLSEILVDLWAVAELEHQDQRSEERRVHANAHPGKYRQW